MKARREKLLENAARRGYAAVAAFEPENVFYLTGFWGEAIALCTAEATQLIAPKLEAGRARESSVDCEVVPTERGGELVSTFVSKAAGRSTCADCSDYAMIESIRKLTGNSFKVDTEPFFQARRVKDEKEIKTIADASRILDSLFEVCV
ncbi:MAG TPA: aminopeptidase P family N-terminal domain-containing protein, partial [Nitrososphaera sp.]|nr:aminopeptidase P family N-terminal domain-containing protein [Nitrososphaera sp.]